MSHVDRESPDGEDTLAWVIEGNRVSLGDLTGRTLGDFQVERLLGRGGMGEVYLATQLSLNRPVALKVLRPDVLSKSGYQERFESEAMAVAKLNHPSIVHVYAMARIDQVHFIAMEYVEGINLREYIRKRGALDLPQALSIMKQTAQAIGAAGEAGLIHRDVKPENILITKRGRVKVADFGLCRHTDGEEMHLTQAGVTMGTPAYMSPEQAQGYPLDHRSDLYSLGVTYYFMLAGVPPFQAETAVALALKQIREIPPSLLIHRPDLPLELDRLVMKLMAKDPADRYQSAAEMLADLARMREVIQLSGGPQAGMTETVDPGMARTEEVGASPSPRDLAVRGRYQPPATVTRDRRPVLAAVPVASQSPAVAPDHLGESLRPVLSGLFATLAILMGLCVGGLVGWTARAPDLQSIADEPSRNLPGLWIEPRWNTIPKQPTPEGQLRYAQLQAPGDDWAAAWLAVPGYHHRSRDASSTAYVQLARLWYRQDDVESLGWLGAELRTWKDAQKRDKDLASLIQLALNLKKGDLGEVEKRCQKFSQTDEVKDFYDPALVAMSVEVCSDALQLVQKAGTQTIAEPIRKALRSLTMQLYHIQVGERARLANPASKAAPKSNN